MERTQFQLFVSEHNNMISILGIAKCLQTSKASKTKQAVGRKQAAPNLIAGIVPLKRHECRSWREGQNANRWDRAFKTT